MKNLNEFGVQEMNSGELKETDGGILLLLAAAVTYIEGKLAYESCAGMYQMGYDMATK